MLDVIFENIRHLLTPAWWTPERPPHTRYGAESSDIKVSFYNMNKAKATYQIEC